MRSFTPSSGPALACTQLSVLFGSSLRPSSPNFALAAARIEPSAALAGLVAPITSPRNCAHESSSGLKPTTKRWIDASSSTYFSRIAG